MILSSVGVTAYPYCLWIKSLGLSDLEQLLQDIAGDRGRRSLFFEGPMSDFEILSEGRTTRAGQPHLEIQKIVEKVGDAITSFAHKASEKQNKTVQLTSFEGANLPTPLLSVWTSRLSTLTILSVRDGSVLTAEVAESIHQNCPFFRELTCYHIQGSHVDQNMSEFFRGLRDDSLQNFRVVSTNEMGPRALEGLMNHARSLRSLTLSSLGTTSLPFLHLLTSLQYLEELNIEASTTSPPSTWAPEGEDPLPMLTIWLKGCRSLKQLSISKLAGGSKLLSDVLVSPDLRLRKLDVRLVDDDEAFYSALGHQVDLETLVFRSYAETTDQNGVRHDKFLDSICACRKLRHINIIQDIELGIDQVQLTTEDLFLIRKALRNLEELSFEGENLTDAIFEPLAHITSLKAVYISGLSLFTYDGIKFFIEALQAAGTHDGFRLEIASQHGDAKIPVRLEKKLARLVNSSLNGYFSLVYFRDLSEDDTPPDSD
ncbi:hypothetical protein SLS53_009240 [Cytospora paraplurivora]|uniref:F-box domain-containing protein n=1 Tax=Cytospora paraplurivora TaxID=2898453 RepID=A0AAN9TZ08_9PEZI